MNDYILWIGFVLIVLIIFFYFKTRKRKPYEITDLTSNFLEEHVEFYQALNSEEKDRFIKRVKTFLEEVYINGINTEVTELDKLLVASSAVIPVFNFPSFHYHNLDTVLIYPSTFNQELEFGENAKDKRIGGMVGTGRYENQMILSQKALRAGFDKHNKEQNTGIHEFVHLIDKMDGETDGVPQILMKHSYTIPWLKIIHKEMRRINHNDSDIRDYGATSETEFLAVASEYFFNKPEAFQKKHPQLYQLMSKFFRQTI